MGATVDLTQRLANRVAVVTGGGSGIGLATAHRLAAEGAKVVIADRDATTGAAAAEAVGGLFVAVDVTNEAQVRSLFDATVEAFGTVDIAFNNAGISPPDDDSILTTGLEAWQRVQDVNLTSVFLCCKYALPHMQRQGRGSIINTASFVAVMGAATSQISYTASKGGVLAMSREIPGLVESSSNLAVVRTEPGVLRLTTSSRSSVGSALTGIVRGIRAAAALAGARIEAHDGYPGWQPDLASPVLGQADVERFERTMEQIRRETRAQVVKDVPAGQRALVDYGGYLTLGNLSFDDQRNDRELFPDPRNEPSCRPADHATDLCQRGNIQPQLLVWPRAMCPPVSVRRLRRLRHHSAREQHRPGAARRLTP